MRPPSRRMHQPWRRLDRAACASFSTPTRCVSDWNHGNAHFLRGVLRELQARGHDTLALEPEDGWSRSNLVAAHGVAALEGFHRIFPG